MLIQESGIMLNKNQWAERISNKNQFGMKSILGI